MTSLPATVPTLSRSIARTDHIAELRAELAGALSAKERRQIARELKAAEAEIVSEREAD